MLPKNGGIVMVTFVPGFLSPKVADWTSAQASEESRLKVQFANDQNAVKAGLAAWTADHPAPRATIKDAADHIDHIRSVAGIDHIGLGGDFDGITAVVQGLEDVSTYPALTAELLRRGYEDDDLLKITGQNILRVMRSVEKVAKTLQARRPASATLFEK
jgi:membrane dipeptidase